MPNLSLKKLKKNFDSICFYVLLKDRAGKEEKGKEIVSEKFFDLLQFFSIFHSFLIFGFVFTTPGNLIIRFLLTGLTRR